MWTPRWSACRSSGSLLVLDQLTPPQTLSVSKSAGSLGFLSSQVKCALEIRPVVEVLLGRYLLVTDRAAARSLKTALPQHALLVTLAGEIFSGSG